MSAGGGLIPNHCDAAREEEKNSQTVGIQRELDTRLFLSRSRRKRPAMPMAEMKEAIVGDICYTTRLRAPLLSQEAVASLVGYSLSSSRLAPFDRLQPFCRHF